MHGLDDLDEISLLGKTRINELKNGVISTYEIIALIKDPCKSCIVTGGSPEKITKLAKTLKLSFVQLHYRETLEETRLIAESLNRSIPE